MPRCAVVGASGSETTCLTEDPMRIRMRIGAPFLWKAEIVEESKMTPPRHPSMASLSTAPKTASRGTLLPQFLNNLAPPAASTAGDAEIPTHSAPPTAAMDDAKRPQCE